MGESSVRAVFLIDISVPEPSDVILWKWIGYAVAFGIEYFALKAILNTNVKEKENADETQTPNTPSPLAPEVTKPTDGSVDQEDGGIMPTPEELDQDKQDRQNEIDNSYATTETPWGPNELKPPGEEPPPGIGPKILWGLGKIIELIDNLKGN